MSEAAHSDVKLPLLVIIDACRDEVQGIERIEPSKPSNENTGFLLSLCLSCSRGQQASDDSEFLKDLLDEEQGMFAKNQTLRSAIDYAVVQSLSRDQIPTTFLPVIIPKDLCLRPDPTVATDAGKVIEATKHIATSFSLQEKPAVGPASGFKPRVDLGGEVVAAYSHASAETGADVFRRSLLALLQESLSSLLDESPRWK
eukprot:103868-Hanusia_phi.AAC.1